MIKHPRTGRKSYVLKGESKGGTVVIRMGRKLHRQIAEHADSLGISMNDYAVHVLRQSIENQDGHGGQHADDVLSDTQTTEALQ